MSSFRNGVRAAIPLVLPTFAIGVSFGVLAEPVMGSIAPIVMSLIVFSGAAQFAALTVLTAGGGAVAAVAAGMLMNGRWLPMGLAVGPFLRGGPLRRAAESVAIVDSSFAVSSRDPDRCDAAAGRRLGHRDGDRRVRWRGLRRPADVRARRDVPSLLRLPARRRGTRSPAGRRGGRRRVDRALADAVRPTGHA